MNIVEWLAVLTGLVSVWLAGSKNIMMWFVGMFCNACWFAIGVRTDINSIMINSLLFFILNLRGLFIWLKHPPNRLTQIGEHMRGRVN